MSEKRSCYGHQILQQFKEASDGYTIDPHHERIVNLKWLASNNVQQVTVIHNGDCAVQAFLYTYILHTSQSIVISWPLSHPTVAKISSRWFHTHAQVYKQIRDQMKEAWEHLTTLVKARDSWAGSDGELEYISALASELFTHMFQDVDSQGYGCIGMPNFEKPSVEDCERGIQVCSRNEYMTATGFNQLFWRTISSNFLFGMSVPEDNKVVLLKFEDTKVKDPNVVEAEIPPLHLVNSPCLAVGGYQAVPVHHNRMFYDIFIHSQPDKPLSTTTEIIWNPKP